MQVRRLALNILFFLVLLQTSAFGAQSNFCLANRLRELLTKKEPPSLEPLEWVGGGPPEDQWTTMLKTAPSLRRMITELPRGTKLRVHRWEDWKENLKGDLLIVRDQYLAQGNGSDHALLGEADLARNPHEVGAFYFEAEGYRYTMPSFHGQSDSIGWNTIESNLLECLRSLNSEKAKGRFSKLDEIVHVHVHPRYEIKMIYPNGEEWYQYYAINRFDDEVSAKISGILGPIKFTGKVILPNGYVYFKSWRNGKVIGP